MFSGSIPALVTPFRGGVFEETAKLDVPQPLRDISYFVSEREFRMDVSSTTLRRERLACESS